MRVVLWTLTRIMWAAGLLALGSEPLPAAPVPTAPEGQPCWVVEQYNRIDGKSTLYLTTNAVRVVQPGDVIVISKAPDWDVCMFSLTSRKYFKVPLPKFENHLNQSMAILYGVNLAGIPLKVGASATVCSITGRSYNTPMKLSWKDYWHGVDDKRRGRYPSEVEAVYSDAFKTPTQEAQVVCRLYGIPIKNEMPLKFDYKDQDGDLTRHLHTLSVKKEKLAESALMIPTDLKPAKTANEVFAGSVNQYMIDTFWGDVK